MANYSIADVYGGQAPEGAGATPVAKPSATPKSFSVADVMGTPPVKKQENSTLKDVMQSQVGMAEHLVSFWDKMAVGLNEATKSAIGIDLNAIGERHGFMGTKQVAERAELLSADAKKNAPKTVVGGLSTIPAYMSTLYPQVVMAGSDMYEDLTGKGVDKKTAMKAAGAATTTAILNVVVPFGRGLVKGAASGAGISVGTLVGQNKFNEWLLAGNYPKIAEEFKVTKDDLVQSGVTGLVMGGLVGKLTGKKLDSPEVEKATSLFADMAKDDPKGANAVIESTKKVDPKLAKELQAKIADMTMTKPKLDKLFKTVKTDSVEHAKGVVTESDVQKMFDAGKMEKATVTEDHLGGGQAAPQQDQTLVTPDQAAAGTRNVMRTGYDLVTRTSESQTSPPQVGFTMPTKTLMGIRFADRDKLPTGTERAGQQHPAVMAPVTVLVDPNGMAFLQDGNHRVTAAGKSGVENMRVTVEKTDKPFTKEQLAAAKPVKELGIDPEKIAVTNKSGDIFEKRQGAGGDQIMEFHSGIPVTKENMKATFELAKQHVPILKTWEKELKDSWEVSMRAVSPESLGPEAKSAGAITARAVAKQAQADSAATKQAQARRNFWQSRGEQANLQFLFDYEKGKPIADPVLEEARLGYEREYSKINAFDDSKGIKYEARENYLYHTFEDSEGVDKFFNRRYGAQWNDPKFTRQRGFELYHQAIEAGFKPRFTNPEDILLARQHASNIAGMRVETLQDMERLGLGRKVVKGQRPEVGETEWRSPNGQRYWVHDDASQILHNAFDTKSLWQMKGPVGSTFRGAMGLKNIYVPLKLAISGFHLLHVATIDNYTGMVRASKGLLAGSVTPGEWGRSMLRGVTFADTYGNPKAGGQLMQLWNRDPSTLSGAERTTLQYMFDGGFIPEMSSQWKIGALEKFKDAVAAKEFIGATARAPMAMIEAFQKPMFEIWIPRLKANAYVQDIASAMKANPELVHNEKMRIEAFRKIAKSVDNRYGEMAYNTLFMNRTVKDSLVASSLSMGWWLGFLREYGGAGMDLAKGVASKQGISTLAKQGDLDRALFVGLYTSGSLMLGGLMNYSLSGQTPAGWKDYVYPKSGGKNPDGTDKRISTMFYTREFGGIALHAQEEGLLRGIEQHIANKASPVLGTAKSMVTNLDYFGNEISDPAAPAFQQLQQKLGFAFKEMEPITFEAAAKGGSTRDKVLPFLGLNPAPAYASETPAEAKIKTMYHTYHSHVTPFVQAQINTQKRELKELYKSGDTKAYNEKLTEVQREHHLSPEQMLKIRKGLAGHHDSSATMFKQLTADEQLKVLKSMSTEDRKKYLRYAHKETRRGLGENSAD